MFCYKRYFNLQLDLLGLYFELKKPPKNPKKQKQNKQTNPDHS